MVLHTTVSLPLGTTTSISYDEDRVTGDDNDALLISFFSFTDRMDHVSLTVSWTPVEDSQLDDVVLSLVLLPAQEYGNQDRSGFTVSSLLDQESVASNIM